jgi:hypothetical protein
MKKLLAVSIVLVLVASAAFGQVSVGAYTQTKFTPLSIELVEGQDAVVTGGSSLVWVNPSFSGSSDYVGFGIGLLFQASPYSGAFGPPSDPVVSSYNNSIWAKPLGNDLLKVEVGNFTNGALGGKIGDFGSNVGYFGSTGADTIFKSFNTIDGPIGGLISSEPIPGLFIGLLVPGAAGTELGALYSKVQVGFGYVLDGIGHVRFQYIGADGTYASPAAGLATENGNIAAQKLQLAFAYTGIAGVTVDFGFTFPFAVKNADLAAPTYTAQAPYVAALGANFTTGDLGILAEISTDFGGKVTQVNPDLVRTTGLGLIFALTPSYNLGTIGVSGNVSFKIDPGYSVAGVETAGSNALGLAAQVNFPFANGALHTGVGFQIEKLGQVDAKTSVQLPIVLEAWF